VGFFLHFITFNSNIEDTVSIYNIICVIRSTAHGVRGTLTNAPRGQVTMQSAIFDAPVPPSDELDETYASSLSLAHSLHYVKI